MKVDSGVKHYASKQDYLNKRTLKTVLDAGRGSASELSKVEISQEAKKASELQKSEKVNLSKDSLKENLKQNVSEVKGAGKRLAEDALSAAKNIVTTPGLGFLVPDISISAPEVVPVAGTSALEKIEVKTLDEINRPGIFFISGLHLNGISSDGGLPELASELQGATHFSWKEEDSVLQEILRRPSDVPLVLVGHSLGGDAAVSIANKLNSLKNGFRKIDLLVTLDSVGFDNDIIPANVKKNLNFIGDKDVFFNDGPNIARDINKTLVVNELRPESHTQLDEARDIQEKIFDNVRTVMNDFKHQKRLERIGQLIALERPIQDGPLV